MSTQTVKIRKHLSKHKEAYIVGGVCLTVGVVATLVVTRKYSSIVISDVANLKFNSPTITQISVEIPKPGNSGNMIYCAMNDTIYPSQNSLAKALNMNQGEISKIINGKIPDTMNLGLKKIAENGIAVAS